MYKTIKIRKKTGIGLVKYVGKESKEVKNLVRRL